MERDPSLHITLSVFIQLLEKAGVEDAPAVAVNVMKMAVPYSLKNRYIVTGDSKTRKKAQRTIDNNQAIDITVERFNKLLMAARAGADHQVIRPILKNSPDFNNLKEVMALAVTFAKDYKFSNIDQGCSVFLSTGLKLMKRSSQYSINKFKSYAGKISNIYETTQAVQNDQAPERTEEFYSVWCAILSEQTGLQRSIPKDSTDWVYMVYGREEADKVEADYEQWVRAQFDGLSYLADTPNINQLSTDGAINRYYEYIARAGTVQSPSKSHAEQKANFEANYAAAMEQLKRSNK